MSRESISRAGLLQRLRRLRRSDEGSVSIEAVLWVPFFLILFAAIADISFIFFNQSKILRVVQDANRNVSVGRLLNQEEVTQFIQTALGRMGQAATVTTTIEAGYITSKVQIPATAMDGLGVLGAFKSLKVTVEASHLREI